MPQRKMTSNKYIIDQYIKKQDIPIICGKNEIMNIYQISNMIGIK